MKTAEEILREVVALQMGLSWNGALLAMEQYAEQEVAKTISSNGMLADNTKTDSETEIIDAYMKEAKKYYPKKKQIRF